MFFTKSLKNIDDKEYLGNEDYTILKTPNDPLIKYKGLKFSTQTDLFIYKNQNYVNDNMKWLEIQTFKIYYDKKYSLQCLYIKNENSINKKQVILYSQCFYTNLATTLPFLVDLSNYLKINIITYEYNNKEKKESNYYDINIIYNYLYKIEFITNIILLGLSVGNKINMDVILSSINLNLNKKLKAFIFISPTWVYDLSDLKTIENFSLIREEVGQFLLMINQLNIPIFIIHGKQDVNVKYFLSLSFSQKIKNKYEWFPKNGTHYDIINEHRTKLLIKLKEFLLHFNLLNKENTIFDTFSKNEVLSINDNLEDRKTAFFNENQNKNKNNIDNKNNIKKNNKKNENYNEEDYDFGHYNNYHMKGTIKNTINNENKNNVKKTDNNIEKNNNINNNELYSICQSKIKDEDNITLNQNIKGYDNITINQNLNDDVTLNQNMKEEEPHSLYKNNKMNMNITLNQDNINHNFFGMYKNMEDNISINLGNIEYDENEIGGNNIVRESTISFIPGDIIPNFKNKKANANQSYIFRRPTKRNNRNISYVSFNY